jgi:hypothetical protein
MKIVNPIASKIALSRLVTWVDASLETPNIMPASRTLLLGKISLNSKDQPVKTWRHSKTCDQHQSVRLIAKLLVKIYPLKPVQLKGSTSKPTTQHQYYPLKVTSHRVQRIQCKHRIHQAFKIKLVKTRAVSKILSLPSKRSEMALGPILSGKFPKRP